MTSTKVQQASTPSNALLGALDGTDRRRAAGVLLALAAQLLEGEEEATAAAEWLTLDEARAVLGLVESRGGDRNRSTKDRLRALGVEVSRVGRSLLVRRASLEAALAAKAKPLRPPPVRSMPKGSDDDGSAALARAGLHLVGGPKR